MSTTSKEGILAVCGTLMGLSTSAVGLRFYARKQQKAKLWIDDWIVLPAFVAYIAAAACVLTMVQKKDLGYSSHDFTPTQLAAMGETSVKLQIVFDILHAISLACIKLSALFFYRRIFCVNGRREWFNILTIATIIIVVLWLVVFEFLAGFQCGTHFSALWDGNFVKYCTISFPFLYGLTVSNLILDVWTLILPIPRIMRLQISTQKKLSITGIFLLAFVGLGAVIARMVILIQQEKGGPAYFLSHDEEQGVTRYVYLSMLEAGMSLVAVNIPSLWTLCSTVIPEKVVRGTRSMLSIISNLSGRSSSSAGQTVDKPSSAEASRAQTPPESSEPNYHKGPYHTYNEIEGNQV